jgi:hypothetical protein
MNQEKKVMATARPASFAIKAIVPRVVAHFAPVEAKILDFGCGKDAVHVGLLREKGLDVVGHDFSRPAILPFTAFDFVYASNVLNVQSSEAMLRITLSEIRSYLRVHGEFIANYPKDPRFCTLGAERVLEIVEEVFRSKPVLVRDEIPLLDGTGAKRVGTKQAPVFMVRRGI